MKRLYEFTDVPVEYHDDGIDWRRLLHLLVQAGITPRGSLRGRRDDDRQVVTVEDVDLGEIAVFDLWRVRSFDPETKLRRFVGGALEQVARTHGDDYAHHLVDQINTANMTIGDEPDAVHVTVDVDGFPLAAVHRGNLVVGWPRDDEARFVT